MAKDEPTTQQILQTLADNFYVRAVEQFEKDPIGWTVLPLSLYRHIAERGLQVRQQRQQKTGLQL